MDHNVPLSITTGLRIRQVDVLTAYEDEHHEVNDPTLLDRAAQLQRVLFTRDDDLVAEAVRRQREGVPFPGMVYGHQLRVSIGAAIRDLELIAKAGEIEDLVDTIQFLPL
jgi:hypothetical protein